MSRWGELEVQGLPNAHDSVCPFESDDPFDDVVVEILRLNRRKRADYTGGEDPWQNFRDSSTQVGQVPGFSAEVLIGTKQARLKQLLFTGREVNNESVRDSLIDRAVYSIIALAMYDKGLYATAPVAEKASPASDG